jgi:hypothetical protein
LKGAHCKNISTDIKEVDTNYARAIVGIAMTGGIITLVGSETAQITSATKVDFR